MHILAQRQFLGHETNFNKGPHSVLQQAVVDLIDIGKVIDGMTLFVFVVNADFVMQDVMKAHITKLSDFLDFA
jgi:hypothetical protein